MIAVIDYDTGNVASVLNMLRRVGADAVVSRDPSVLCAAEKLVLPGVGAFDQGMINLQRFGLDELLTDLVVHKRRPILGVCLGAQLMTKSSEEGTREGLGWLDARLVRFRSEGDSRIRIPHMGWNTVRAVRRAGDVFDGIDEPMRFYFVHSYHMVADDSSIELAATDYGYTFASALGSQNVLAFQFHPEKSHRYGMQVYRNFAERFAAC